MLSGNVGIPADCTDETAQDEGLMVHRPMQSRKGPLPF